MKRFTLILIISVLIAGVLASSCKRKNKEDADLTLSQNDIDLLVTHKKQIDIITGKYDRELQKSPANAKAQVVQNGKDEINRYLESKNLDSVVFMRKSKKILKGFLAFHETGQEALERKIRLLQTQELTEKQYEQALEAYKKSNDELFKEYTSGLTDYEIELIKMNIQKLSGVVKYSTVNTVPPAKKPGRKSEKKK